MAQVIQHIPTQGALRQEIRRDPDGQHYLRSSEDLQPLIEQNASIRLAKEAVRKRNGVVSHRWPALLWYAEFPAEFHRQHGVWPLHACPPSQKPADPRQREERLEMWRAFMKRKSNDRDYDKFRVWDGRL